MKKYFMKDTEEELQFDDMIEVDFSEKMDNGKTSHHHLECKFIPELVDMLLEHDIIEVREAEGEEEEEEYTFDAEELEEIFDEIIESQENIKSQLGQVTAILSDMQKLLENLTLEQTKAKKDVRKPAGK